MRTFVVQSCRRTRTPQPRSCLLHLLYVFLWSMKRQTRDGSRPLLWIVDLSGNHSLLAKFAHNRFDVFPDDLVDDSVRLRENVVDMSTVSLRLLRFDPAVEYLKHYWASSSI